MKRITFSEGVTYIDAVYAATTAGCAHAASRKVSFHFNKLSDAGRVSDTILKRLNNYNFEVCTLRIAADGFAKEVYFPLETLLRM